MYGCWSDVIYYTRNLRMSLIKCPSIKSAIICLFFIRFQVCKVYSVPLDSRYKMYGCWSDVIYYPRNLRMSLIKCPSTQIAIANLPICYLIFNESASFIVWLATKCMNIVHGTRLFTLAS